MRDRYADDVMRGNDNWCPPLFTERSAVNRGGVPKGRRGLPYSPQSGEY